MERLSGIWAEASRDLRRCGIELKCARIVDEIRRSPSGAPIFEKLLRGAVNVAITDRVPTQWDNGRGLSGVSTRYQGFPRCVIALDHAHGHRIPFFSVNTCVHELLYVFLQDIYENRPKELEGETREARVDLYATKIWLVHDGGAVRKAAESYVTRLLGGQSPRNEINRLMR